MNNVNNIRTGRHCVFKMHVHLVFVAKYRKKIFSKKILDSMRTIFEKVCKDFEASLLEFDGEQDHVHLLVEYHPKIAISRLVNSLKGSSSRLLRNKFPELKQYYVKRALWSPSYFAGSCGGAPLTVIKDYIKSQNSPT